MSLRLLARCLLLGIAFSPIHLSAALIFYTSRAAFPGNDLVEWGTVGGEFTTPPNPFDALSNDGLDVNVSTTGPANFIIAQQHSSWSGNFADGDLVLYEDAFTTLSLTFATPVEGAGAQVQPNLFTIPNFLVTLAVFGTDGAKLGDVTFKGTSTSNDDNSAGFFGILSDSEKISRITFNLPDSSEGRNGFAINEVSIAEPVPEPASLGWYAGLLAVAAALLEPWRSRRGKITTATTRRRDS